MGKTSLHCHFPTTSLGANFSAGRSRLTPCASLQNTSPPHRHDRDRGHDQEDPVCHGATHRGPQTLARPPASLAIWRRGRRLAQLTTRRPGRDGVDRPACSRQPRQILQTVAKAAQPRSEDPINVALPRSGKVLQRSKNRFKRTMVHWSRRERAGCASGARCARPEMSERLGAEDRTVVGQDAHGDTATAERLCSPNRNSMDNGRRCCRAEWYSSPQIPSTEFWAVAVAAVVSAPVVVARVAAVRRARSAAVRKPVAAVAGQQMAVAAG